MTALESGINSIKVLDLDNILLEMGTGDRVILERQEDRDFKIVSLRPRISKLDKAKRGRPQSPINLSLVDVMIEEGYSYRQIAKKMKCSHTTLLARLKKEKIEKRREAKASA